MQNSSNSENYPHFFTCTEKQTKKYRAWLSHTLHITKLLELKCHEHHELSCKHSKEHNNRIYRSITNSWHIVT